MQIKTNIRFKEPRPFLKPVIALLILLVIGTGLIIGVKNYYDNISIIGKWTSLVTGAVVEFEENGIVKVNNVETGDYVISSPELMIYNIEGHSFEMNYKVEGRELIWGLVGEGEKFERNGL